MNQEPIKELELRLPELYKDNSCDHNINHILRVVKNAEIIGKEEKADLSILISAAMLHDIALKKGTMPETSSKHALLGAEMAEEILRDCGFKKEEIKKICSTIKQHSIHSPTNEPRTIEGDCIFDADKLDAITPCGFARCMQAIALAENIDTIEIAKGFLVFLETFNFQTKTGQKLGKDRDEVIKFCKLVIKSGQV